jgi:hypothetical protein
MGEAETQRSTPREEFGTSEQLLESVLKIGDAFRIRSDGRNIWPRRWVNQIQVVGDSNPSATGDLQNLVFNIAVECDVCEGGGGSKSGQGFGIELPFVILVAENELSSLMRGGVDDHEGTNHIRSPRCVLVGLEE